jgi:hypothetical protein
MLRLLLIFSLLAGCGGGSDTGGTSPSLNVTASPIPTPTPFPVPAAPSAAP